MNKVNEKDRIFEVDGQQLYIKDPTALVREQAEFINARTFQNAIKNDVPTTEKMLQILKDKDIWNDDQEAEVAALEKEREALLETIEKGGVSLQVARKNAIRVAIIRNQMSNMAARKIEMLSKTADSKARNAEVNFLVASCVVYNQNRNKTYFKDYDEYLNSQDSEQAVQIANKCSDVLYGLPDLDNTPEKRFLKEFNFVDEDMNLINEEGHRIDIDGNLVNDEGHRIKYVGRGDKKRAILVDQDGKEIKEQKRKPFLDDDGNPIKPPKAEDDAKSDKDES